uniref:Uncharacterized protein n=1 Tax=Neobodo designis TaxID=312471 RepID=A0A7S1LEP0_NEODS
MNDDFIRGAKDCAAELAEYIRLSEAKEREAQTRGAADASVVGDGADTDDDDEGSIVERGSRGPRGSGAAVLRTSTGSAPTAMSSDDGEGDDTLIERPAAGRASGAGGRPSGGIPGRATERAAIPPGMLVDMPIVSLDEMTLDELAGGNGAPPATLAEKIFGPNPARAELAASMPRATHTTEVLAQCMHHHRTASKQRALTAQEAAAHERQLLKYTHIVRSSLGV